ncbi:MAG TPA: FkbM family methyltransferase [Gemmatimonadales bacterium]|nr:FkbM family methyltransferase [Gemmatimonadales bacterium]
MLDVGANTGQYGKELRAIGYKGRIVSFEPLTSAYKELLKTANSDGSWIALRFALGDAEGKAVLNIAGNSMSSSILDMLPSHAKSAPESQYVGREQVEVRTLDSVFDTICSQEQSILLKIDTQGFEKHVLDGAERSLRFINTIQLEMSLIPLYQGELLFPELSQLLYQKGYRLASIEPVFADRETGQLLQIDGIFHRQVATADPR